MQITLNTSESSADELTALIALLASLGGRLPAAGGTFSTVGSIEIAVPTAAQVEESAQAIAAAIPAELAERVTTSNDAGDLVDSSGTPWDARIHSESKAVNADKTWRKRRGVSDELFHQVMTELHADNDEQDDAPPPPPADTGNAEASPEDVPAPPALTEDVPSAPEPAASAPDAGSPGQFADFPSFVAAVSKHGKTYVELNELAGMLGVPMFKDMKDHADKWDAFFAMVG